NTDNFLCHSPSSLAARDDECLIALCHPLPKVARPTTPGPLNPVACPPFVDAEATVHPLQALPAARREQTAHDVAREWMVLFFDGFPVRRVGVRLLPLYGEAHGTFIGEDMHRMALAQGRLDNAKGGGGIGRLKRRIHHEHRQRFLHLPSS